MARVRARRVIVRWKAGPTWTSGNVDQQPGWNEHAAYIDDLIERGIFVMGGPLADNSGSVSLLEGVDEAEARELIATDPLSQTASSSSTMCAPGTCSSTS